MGSDFQNPQTFLAALDLRCHIVDELRSCLRIELAVCSCVAQSLTVGLEPLDPVYVPIDQLADLPHGRLDQFLVRLVGLLNVEAGQLVQQHLHDQLGFELARLPVRLALDGFETGHRDGRAAAQIRELQFDLGAIRPQDVDGLARPRWLGVRRLRADDGRRSFRYHVPFGQFGAGRRRPLLHHSRICRGCMVRKLGGFAFARPPAQDPPFFRLDRGTVLGLPPGRLAACRMVSLICRVVEVPLLVAVLEQMRAAGLHDDRLGPARTSGELLLDPARELVRAEGQGADVFVVRGEHDALGIGGERQGPAAADFDELT